MPGRRSRLAPPAPQDDGRDPNQARLSGEGESELKLFLDMLMAERGAAANTIEAYSLDLGAFLAYLAQKRTTARDASADTLRLYLAELSRKGLAPTSRSRKLSAIRQFFRFLLAEGLRADDPCSAIDSPKLGRPLPKLLSLAEVESLLGTAADAVEQAGEGVAKRRALRMQALMETLYATGLRVSELLSLPRHVLTTDDRVLTVKGKGGRERLVPLNPERSLPGVLIRARQSNRIAHGDQILGEFLGTHGAIAGRAFGPLEQEAAVAEPLGHR